MSERLFTLHRPPVNPLGLLLDAREPGQELQNPFPEFGQPIVLNKPKLIVCLAS